MSYELFMSINEPYAAGFLNIPKEAVFTDMPTRKNAIGNKCPCLLIRAAAFTRMAPNTGRAVP